MNINISPKEVPHNYTMCVYNECPLAENCLRRLAFDCQPETEVSLKVINPKCISPSADGCSHYRPAKKLRYAKGFVNILESLPKKVWKAVGYKLQLLFHGRTYYRVRKGERLLSPQEQQAIIYLLKEGGMTEIPDFDAYVEDYAW